jgi:hypothetical protein
MTLVDYGVAFKYTPNLNFNGSIAVYEICDTGLMCETAR